MKRFVIFVCALALQGPTVPALRWVRQFGDSGKMTAVASATDGQCNLYLVGNTSSLRLTVTSATQPHPGGSPLVRIDAASLPRRGFTSPPIAERRGPRRQVRSRFVPDPSKLASQNPNLTNFKFPPQVAVLRVVGPVYAPPPAFYTVHSQIGLALSVKPAAD